MLHLWKRGLHSQMTILSILSLLFGPFLEELVISIFWSRYLNDDNFIRVAHALETLAVLLREIFKKRFNEQVMGIPSAQLCMLYREF